MRIIAHIDMDAFFAAIEERDSPQFKGKPLVIGADPKGGYGRGVVSTANYAARKYGIHSAMPISRAWKLAEKAKQNGEPETIFLPGNMRRYIEVSNSIMKILDKHADKLEEASVDEAYLDVTSSGSYDRAKKLAAKIKKEIKQKENLTCSVGIGPNKLISKIASDMQKPDGLTIVNELQAEDFLEPLSIRKIPGIGPKTEKLFNSKGIYSVKDMKKYSQKQLENLLGKWGTDLYFKIRGVDDSPIIEEYETKSIGEQETFEEDSKSMPFVLERTNIMAKSIIDTFKKNGFKTFKTITLTVRFEDFTTKNRSHTLKEPADSVKILKMEILKLMMPFFDKRENPKSKKIRLIGVRIEKLT